MSEQPNDIKLLRKEMNLIIKENKKLQNELKTKNESMATLINQNFVELQALQEKHDRIVNSLSATYDDNIKKINGQYAVFRDSMHIKLKDNVATRYKLNNERVLLLETCNKELTSKIIDLQQDKNTLEDKINSLSNQKKIFNKQMTDVMATFENHILIKNDYEKKLTDLTIQYNNLQEDLHLAQQELGNGIDTIKSLTTERDSARSCQQDFQNKYMLLLNDNVLKQTSIDEKTLEILSLSSKISELEKRNLSHESCKKDTNIRLTELINQVDNLQTELLSANKSIRQLKDEKDNILEEKMICSKDMENYKLKMRELELNMLEQIKQIHDGASIEKEKYIYEQEKRAKEMREKCEKQLDLIKSETNSILSEREKQIDGLTSYLKSLSDNQHLTITEIEKLKLTNEKLRAENYNVDQKINDVHFHYKREMEEFRLENKREKDSLMETYHETIKKSQELNDALQHRLNQTIETLTISKTTISNLKETNQHLEKQIYARESDGGILEEKYNQIRSENTSLREKLDRSIELNNNFSNREKHYEAQIGQLRTKYGQLVAMTKKNMNISSN